MLEIGSNMEKDIKNDGVKYIVANWKMNKKSQEAVDFASKFNMLTKSLVHTKKRKVVICPTNLQIFYLKTLLENGVMLGAQNCYFENQGAYTGEVGPDMLADMDVAYCIVGHSERRTLFFETDEDVSKKAKALYDSNIMPIICVGENKDIYTSGKTLDFLKQQISDSLEFLRSEKDFAKEVVLAYEPVWSIGTGIVGDIETLNGVGKSIKEFVQSEFNITPRVLYGGSVKSTNAKEFLACEGFDGLLVGGASLDPAEFAKIVFA